MKTFARELSLGQRMRADLAMMLLHSPELILLDKPTLGLDMVAKRILMVAGGKIVYDGCFDGLQNVTGNLTRFIVTTDGIIPDIGDGQLLSDENGVFEFKVDLNKAPIKSLLRRLSETDGIKDVEIKKAPIEQVIAELYKRWR